MMTSAGGATHICPARQLNCVAPPGLDTVFAFYPGLTPWATSCRAYRRWVTKGKGDINRPEVNLAWIKSFWRGHDFSRGVYVKLKIAGSLAVTGQILIAQETLLKHALPSAGIPLQPGTSTQESYRWNETEGFF